MNVSLANKLMVDVASHLGEGVMVKDDCIEHEDLCYEQLSKSTTFEPPPPRVDQPRNGWPTAVRSERRRGVRTGVPTASERGVRTCQELLEKVLVQCVLTVCQR